MALNVRVNKIARRIKSSKNFLGVIGNFEKIDGQIVHAGIRNDESALYMGVNNFGDPAHAFPNVSNRNRKIFSYIPSPIPPRPFLTEAQTYSPGRIRECLHKNIPLLVAGGRKDDAKKTLTPNEFLEKVGEALRDNIRENWKSADFEPNAPATVSIKGFDKPLHGKDNNFTEEKITSWVGKK